MGGSKKRKLNWSELCPDVLRCVSERLSFTDLNRAKSVCSSWHSALRGCLPNRNEIPWLILFPRNDEANKDNRCVLFVPQDRDKVYKTRDLGLDFVRSCCLATYGSWLLMMDIDYNLNILNPLTGERIELPLTESLVPEKFKERLKYSLACLWVDERSKDYLVVWTMSWFLVFTKKGNNMWRRMTSNYVGGAESYKQMVYNHKTQMLYVYRSGYAIKSWCFCEDEPQEVFEAKYIYGIGFNCRDFLPDITLYSSRLDRLHWRREEELYCQEFVEGWVNIAITVSGQVLKIASVVQRSKRWLFRIFKTDDLTREWEQMDSLGDEALILDMGITVVAKDIPGIKRNSIYFSGAGYGRKDPDHIFVFDLTTQNIQRLPQCVLSPIHLSDARWFFPGLTH